MIGHQFAPSIAPVRPVKEVQFGILSPEEIVGVLLRVDRCTKTYYSERSRSARSSIQR